MIIHLRDVTGGLPGHSRGAICSAHQEKTEKRATCGVWVWRVGSDATEGMIAQSKVLLMHT